MGRGFVRGVGIAASIALMFVPGAQLAFGLTVGQVATGALLVSGIASARYARKDARRAHEQKLEARRFLARGGAETRPIIIGEAPTGGTLVYGIEPTATQRYLYLVAALADHRCHALVDVKFGDRSIGPLIWNGNTATVGLGSPYYIVAREYPTHTQRVPANRVIELPRTPTNILSVVCGRGDETGYRIVPYTQVGSTVVLDSAAVVDEDCTIQYEVLGEGTSLVQVKFYDGSTTQAADAELMAASGNEWTSAHRLRGVAYAIVRIDPDPNVFVNGAPQISFVVQGANEIEDTRTGTTGYSTNSALVTRWLLRREFGVAAEDIPDDYTNAAANICDEQVTLDGFGATQSRYTCNGILFTDADMIENLERVLSSMAGHAIRWGGQWHIQAGAYTEPTFTLTEDDLAPGKVTVSARRPRRSLFNAVKGRFTSPENNWVLTGYPRYASPVYAAQDGQEIEREIDLPMTNDARMAQRIGKLYMHEERQAVTVHATWKMSAYRACPGRTLLLTMPRYGFEAKPFRIQKAVFHSIGRVELVLKEVAAAIYGHNFSEIIDPDPAPNSNLPDPLTIFPPNPLTLQSGGQYYQMIGGLQIPYLRASWPLVEDPLVRAGGWLEIRWRRAVDTAWNDVVKLDPTSIYYYINPVADGEVIIVQTRAFNRVAYSAWNTQAAVVSTTRPNASNTLAGVGVNLLLNPAGMAGLTYWSLDADGTATTLSLASDRPGGLEVYRPRPLNALVLQSTGAAWLPELRNVRLLSDQWIPVTSGDRLEAQMRGATFACAARLEVEFRTSAGASMGSQLVAMAQPGAGTAILANFPLAWGFVTVPDGAAEARILVRKGHQPPTAISSSRLPATMFYLGRATPHQTQPSPWQGSGAVGTELIERGAVFEPIIAEASNDLSIAGSAVTVLSATVDLNRPAKLVCEAKIVVAAGYNTDGTPGSNATIFAWFPAEGAGKKAITERTGGYFVWTTGTKTDVIDRGVAIISTTIDHPGNGPMTIDVQCEGNFYAWAALARHRRLTIGVQKA